MDVKEIKNMVQEAIDNGATTVEDIHKKIAAMPLEGLKKLGLPEEKLNAAQELQNNTIGTVYDFIRDVNAKAGEMANDLLAKLGK